MLGFSTTHIGGTPKTSDAPDLIATTPLGNFLVIECTTGILKQDHKLPHVVERAAKVRQSLAASGNKNSKVLPVIVTTKTHEEVRGEIAQAHELGVVVGTRESFDQVFNRTLLFPDANQVFAELEQSLSQLKHNALSAAEG